MKEKKGTDLLVEDILTRNIRSNVTTDRVSNSIRTMGVKLSSRVSLGLGISVILTMVNE
jgi:hypothetical protein